MKDYKGITGDSADTNRDEKVDFTKYDSNIIYTPYLFQLRWLCYEKIYI